MTLKIQQSEATASLRRLLFVLVDIGDGFTKETGLSAGFTIYVSKAGGTPASGGGSITELNATNAPGQYYYEFTSGEVDTLGFIAVSIRHASCRDVDGEVQVVAYDPYSATNLGLTDITQIITDIGNLNDFDYSSEQVSISGTIQTLDALVTDLESNHGATSWVSAVGFSTHSAANVWGVGTKEITGGALTTPANYMADVSAIISALPTNYIMGSASQQDYSDEITAIYNKLPTGDLIDEGDVQTAIANQMVIAAGTVEDPPAASATVFQTSLGETDDDHYNGQLIVFTSGNLIAQGRFITDYEGSSGTITVSPGFTEAPANGNQFNLFGSLRKPDSVLISGTIDTLDALDTALDVAHGAGSWLTGGAGGATILTVPSIPKNIDLADTKTVRIALYLTDQNDDLPTTGEITPGTIKIDRSADGGTSWSTIRNDVACSEHAGAVYYDEVFSSGNGYASADMIRITFKGQIVTIAANDHEITDGTNGMVFITRMDSGLSGGGPSAGDIADAVWEEAIVDHSTSSTFGGKNQLVVPSETLADYKADVSNLDQAISTTESNIRGGTETLETLMTELGLIHNDVDDIVTYTGTDIPATITTMQADLDNPTQYKATGFSVPNEYDTVIAALQTDLDNPAQYKADVSALALEASLFDPTATPVEILATGGAAGGKNAQELVDDFWDELVADHIVSDSLGETLRRIKGLCGENAVMEFGIPVDKQTSGGKWLYDTDANAQTHNKATGKIGEYIGDMTFTLENPNLRRWKKVG